MMKGLLKFITCGSVDDGKSTLIGHILYDSKLLYADQEKALLLDSAVGSAGGDIDYSLLLDGLIAEREQGITIDVAYRYFTTDHRSFIVADTPGHEEYTRNMAVGASFADLAVILLDATQGVLVQTRRHARICALMGIHHFVFAINKMDLVDYSQERFEEIKKDIDDLSAELQLTNTHLIPVSATVGDNITTHSDNTPWYQGPSLLSYLEDVDVDEGREEQGFYLPVQRVCRPDHTFRGFQGQVESGEISSGQEVTLLPSGEKANIKSIHVGDKKVDHVFTGQPATIQLDREVDVSRGNVIVDAEGLKVASTFTAEILWMDDNKLVTGKNFYVKIGTKMIPGIITDIIHQIDVNTGEKKKADHLSKNEIALCRFVLSDRIVIDEFKKHRTLGELIVIDRVTNMTSACGVVNEVYEDDHQIERINRDTRALINGQRAIVVELPLTKDFTLEDARQIEASLVHNGRHTYLYHPDIDEPVYEVIKHLHHAGLVVLLVKEDVDVSKIRTQFSSNIYHEIEPDKDIKKIAKKILALSDVSVDILNGEYI